MSLSVWNLGGGGAPWTLPPQMAIRPTTKHQQVVPIADSPPYCGEGVHRYPLATTAGKIGKTESMVDGHLRVLTFYPLRLMDHRRPDLEC